MVPAAGVGARLGAALPKQYLEIGGASVLARSVRPLLDVGWIERVLVVVAPGDRRAAQACADLAARAGGRLRIAEVGGATRRDSVLAGLEELAAAGGDPGDWVLVHDAARPGLDAALIEKLITTIGDDAVGGLLALPVVDTVKRAGAAVATVPRDGLWLAQTPQMFRYRLLCDALAAATDASVITDDASAVEAMGLSPRLVEGHPRNLKVTLPADIRIAEMFLASS